MSKRRKKGSAVKKIAYVLGALVLVYTIAMWRFANGYLSPERTVAAAPPAPLRERTFTLADVETPTWCTPGLAASKPRSNVVFVLVHGYKADRSVWQKQMLDLHAAGYEAIAPALPGHDANPEIATGFGMKEADRIIELTKVLQNKSRAPLKFVGVGQSMGGATVWMAVSKDPEAFDAIVSDGAFADLNEAANTWLGREFPGGHIVLRPVISIASLIAGIDPAKVRPMDAATKWKGKPALVIHGQKDELIGRTHADRIAKAAGTTVWEIKGAGHVEGYDVEPKAYTRKLIELANRLK